MKVKYCPLCHTKLIFYFSKPIFSEDYNEIIDHYNIYYCPNYNCSVRKVIYDDDSNILNIYYYRDIKVKYRKLLFSIKQNYRYTKPKKKEKMKEKIKKLEKLLNI